jgi:DNA adenine methylase
VFPTSLKTLPHPIPYQGSKRKLVVPILSFVKNKTFHTLYEPFAGSAAITIAAASLNLAKNFVISDSLLPLTNLWKEIVHTPQHIAAAYEDLWRGQLDSDEKYFFTVRDSFNFSPNSAKLLYLLTRCVKNAPRFNDKGFFNQSYDKRRLGTQPAKLRLHINTASKLLAKRTTLACNDFETVLEAATAADLVYLDPPYEGVTTGLNKRYHQGLERERLISVLETLNQRKIPFLLSYDGSSGNRIYGEKLPDSLNLLRVELAAGRSSQATLNGRCEYTIESLYISKSLLI